MTYQNATGGDSDFVPVPYAPPATGLPLETFTLSSLVQRVGQAELRLHQRPEFELLICCTSGSGFHDVDFERVRVAPGRIVHVRPGQVHRWLLDHSYEARLILMRALSDRTDWSAGAHIIDTDGELDRDLEGVLALADHKHRSEALSIPALEAVRDLLVALLGLRQTPHVHTTHRNAVFRDFERLLANVTPPPRTVKDSADILGCSTRTLARACLSTVGTPPKEMIDQAVAREGQRMLSESGSTAASVAIALGFAEPSHFTRFFKRITGETPSTFAANLATLAS